MPRAFSLHLSRDPTADIVADWSAVKQTVRGFGASDRNCGTITTGTADLLFDQSGGLGLSQLRISFDTNGYNEDSDVQNAVKAAARGAQVWATPWSPPAAWKDNGSLDGGGHLLSARYSDWADAFVAFYTSMRDTYGIHLIGMSPQNEPDQTGQGYPQTAYTTAELVAFIKVLGPKLAALSPRPQLIAPETGNWAALWSYADAIIADSTAAAYLDIVATHDYGYATSTGDPGGRQIWQTEVSTFDPETTSPANGLTVAAWIHRALTTGGCSAWHYWGLFDFNTDNEGLLLSDKSPTKRAYTLGNWSKFVRPGWVRISTSGSVSGLSVTAFRHVSSGAFAIVVVNASGSAKAASIGIKGPTCSSVAPWVTSDTAIGAIGTDGNLSLGSSAASLSSSLAVVGNAVTLTFPGGVTTLVGVAA